MQSSGFAAPVHPTAFAAHAWGIPERAAATAAENITTTFALLCIGFSRVRSRHAPRASRRVVGCVSLVRDRPSAAQRLPRCDASATKRRPSDAARSPPTGAVLGHGSQGTGLRASSPPVLAKAPCAGSRATRRLVASNPACFKWASRSCSTSRSSIRGLRAYGTTGRTCRTSRQDRQVVWRMANSYRHVSPMTQGTPGISRRPGGGASSLQAAESTLLVRR